MLLSVMTIICHNSIAHHHHEDMKPFIHHDHAQQHAVHEDGNTAGDEGQHNVFSYAQLDDNYLPSQSGKLIIEIPVLYLITPTLVLQVDKLIAKSTTHIFHHDDDLVSLYFSSSLFSRPPPTCIA